MTPAQISGPLLQSMGSIYPQSQVLPSFLNVIALAVSAWVSNPLNVQIQGVTSGLAGTGNVLGSTLFVTPSGLVLAELQNAGLTGPTSVGLAQIVESALAQVFVGASYQGASTGVGSGSDVISNITADAASLVALLQLQQAAADLSGPLSGQTCLGLGRGIAQVVRTCKGAGAVTGTASNIPTAGTSISRFL